MNQVYSYNATTGKYAGGLPGSVIAIMFGYTCVRPSPLVVPPLNRTARCCCAAASLPALAATRVVPCRRQTSSSEA